MTEAQGEKSRWRGPLLASLAAVAAVAIAVVATLALSNRSRPAAAQLPRSPAALSPGLAPSSAAQSATESTRPSQPPQPASASAPSPSLGPRPADDKPGPIVLVPGYGGDDTMLVSLADRLQRAGRTTILLELPNNATGDLRGQADILATRVAALVTGGAPSVDLVGYSAGGIVVGLFVATHPAQVRRIVSIGSPLHGTNLAGLAAGLLPSSCPAACQQMVPGNPLLSSLDSAEPTRTGVPWMSLWTTHDQVVQPADSARFPGAVNIALQTVCADDAVTHIDLPSDPLVAALTLRGLSTSDVASPAASECAALRAVGAA